MATPEERARQEQLRQAAAGAAVAGAAAQTGGLAATPGAVAIAGVPVVATAGGALTAAATIKLIREAFSGFQTRRADDIFDMLLALLGERYPDRPQAEREAAVDGERRLEREFQRRSRKRLEEGLKRALKEKDPAKRQAAVERVLEAERRFTLLHEEAVITRAINREEQNILRETSPAGAMWALSPYVQQHTPDCVAMAGRWWPWEVLEKVCPPLHHGCACQLFSLDEAKERGLVPMSFEPPTDVAERIRTARRILKDYPDLRDKLDEALEEAGYREALHPRDRLGRWREAGGYEPEEDASEEGEFVYEDSPLGPVAVQWRQDHAALVRDALWSWKGWPSSMAIHMRDEREGAPIPGSGSGKQMRAQAAALLWELAHNARVTERPLYRGSHVDPSPGLIAAWSENKATARYWAKKGGGAVQELPAGVRGLRVRDYVHSQADEAEREWLIPTPELAEALDLEELSLKLPKFKHKQTPSEFRDRMEGLGHGRLAIDFNPRLHPRDRVGRFIEVLNTMKPPRKDYAGDTVDVKETPYFVNALKGGTFEVEDRREGTRKEVDTAEQAAHEVESKIRHDAAREELERSRAERAGWREERERRVDEERKQRVLELERRQREFDQRYPKNEEGLSYWYRLYSPSQDEDTVRKQLASGEIWGERPRNFFAGDSPKVQAYRGRLPPGEKGIEFVTQEPPDPATKPGDGHWTGNRTSEHLAVEDGVAKLRVQITAQTTLMGVTV